MNFDIRTLKAGDPFITLEQFMALPEYSDFTPERLWTPRFSGIEWIFRYKIARASWAQYHTNPPNGAVKVLVNGHGTHMPNLEREKNFDFIGGTHILNTDEDPNWFILHDRETKRKSLVDKALWWQSIAVIE